MSSFLTQAQVDGTVGLGTAQALQRSLSGHPDLCHFIDPSTGSVLLQCDAVLSETHSRDVEVTSFPLEDGSTISDHIVVPPVELQLQGIVSDAPLGDKAGLITEAIASGLTAVVPPLGVAAAGAGYAAFLALNNTNLAGQNIGASSRSVAAFGQLLRLQGGDPTAQPPVLPRPFNVTTKFRLYTSMVIKSLSVPRDATVGGAIVFQAALTQMLVVRPQTASAQVLAAPALAGAQANLGQQQAAEAAEAEGGGNKLVEAFNNGVKDIHSAAGVSGG